MSYDDGYTSSNDSRAWRSCLESNTQAGEGCERPIGDQDRIKTKYTLGGSLG